MFLPIYQYGHPVLRRMSTDISADYDGLKTLIDNMFDTMYKSDGIGIAAPQIGKNIRLFVIDATPCVDDYPEVRDFKRIFINAHILERSEDTLTTTEGCLSLPGINEQVARSKSIKIAYLDENFQPHEETIEGYCAVVVQHEYDHLDGKVFTDHLGALKKRLLKGKLTAISNGKAKVAYRVVLP